MTKFLLAASSFKHLEFHNRIMTFKTVIIAMYIGFLAGTAAAFYNKIYIGGFIRKLSAKKAFSPEKALTLKEIGCKNTPFLRSALRKKGALRRFAEISNKDECLSEKTYKGSKRKLRSFFGLDETSEKCDFENARFYIPEAKKYTAEARYEKKGSNPVMFLIMAAAATAVAFIAYMEIPELLTMLDNFLGIVISD